jgi:hypothetical protein
VLALQRSAGNRAVSALIARRQRPAVRRVEAGTRRLQRIKWETAAPKKWINFSDRGMMAYGQWWDNWVVQTDRRREVAIMRPKDGKAFFCHGLTFGGATAKGGPFSIDGGSLPILLEDEYDPTDDPQVGDVVAFHASDGIDHTGLVHSIDTGAATKGKAIKIDSKLGSKGQEVLTLDELLRKYARTDARFYRKKAAQRDDEGLPPGMRLLTEEEMIAIDAREIRQRAAAVNELRQGQREIAFLQALLAKLIGGGSLSAEEREQYEAMRG